MDIATRLLARLSGINPDEVMTDTPAAATGTKSGSPSMMPEGRALANYLWDPNAPLVWLSRKDPLSVAQAFAGIHVFGSNGSGKTSGSRTIAKAFLRAGWGGCVLAAKPDDRALWKQMAAETGREGNLIILAADQPWRFNFIAYDLARSERLPERIDNVMGTFKDVLAQAGSIYGGEARAWIAAAEALLKRAVTILAARATPFTVGDIADFIAHAPQSIADVKNEEFESSEFKAAIEAARAATASGPYAAEIERTAVYWLRDYPRLPSQTRESTRFTLDYLLTDLETGTIPELLGRQCNFVPEDSHEGAILLIDLPTSLSRSNVVAQMVFKLIWQQAVLRRQAHDPKATRPVFLWSDESHLLVTPYDATYQSLCRQARAATVYLTQNLNSYFHRLPPPEPKATAHALMGYFQTQIFHAQADPDTIEHAVKLFGKHVIKRESLAVGVTEGDSENWSQGEHADSRVPRPTRQGGGGRERSDTQTSSYQEVLEDRLKPEQLARLKNGGEGNSYRVGAYVFSTGPDWKLTGSKLLYTEFDQRI